MSNETTAPQGWRPSEGDTIVGQVVSLDTGWSDQGKGSYYPIVTLKQDDGTVTNVHCFHAVLQRKLVALAPQVGDKLRITMLGKSKTKDGKREVTNYTVESNRKQDSQSFWDSVRGGSSRRSTPPPAQEPPVSTEDFTQQELAQEDDDNDNDIPF